jgi:hypothetical protein
MSTVLVHSFTILYHLKSEGLNVLLRERMFHLVKTSMFDRGLNLVVCKQTVARAVETLNGSATGDTGQGRLRMVAKLIGSNIS